MTTSPQPPPEAQLITELREQPPRMSRRAAAELAGISEARWRQIENGVRYFRGEPYPETGPPGTIAKMIHAIGRGHSYNAESWREVIGRLDDMGAVDAGAELQALLTVVNEGPLSGRQKIALAGRLRKRDVRDASDE